MITADLGNCGFREAIVEGFRGDVELHGFGFVLVMLFVLEGYRVRYKSYY